MKGEPGEDAPSSAEAKQDSPPSTDTVPDATLSPRPPPPSEPLQAHDVVGSVLLDRIKRNPAPFIGLAVVLLLIRRRRSRRRAAI